MKEMNKCKNPAMKVNIFTSKFLKIQLRIYFIFKILAVITVSRIKTTYLPSIDKKERKQATKLRTKTSYHPVV